MPDDRKKRSDDSLEGHFGKPDGGYESMSQGAGTAPPPAGDARLSRENLYGEHASGRYGTPAYGRTDGLETEFADASQQPSEGGRGSLSERSVGANQNAQISGASASGPLPATSEDERDSPGISTDKHSDDTKPA